MENSLIDEKHKLSIYLILIFINLLNKQKNVYIIRAIVIQNISSSLLQNFIENEGQKKNKKKIKNIPVRFFPPKSCIFWLIMSVPLFIKKY